MTVHSYHEISMRQFQFAEHLSRGKDPNFDGIVVVLLRIPILSPTEGIRNSREGGESHRPKNLKQCMKLN